MLQCRKIDGRAQLYEETRPPVISMDKGGNVSGRVTNKKRKRFKIIDIVSYAL